MPFAALITRNGNGMTEWQCEIESYTASNQETAGAAKSQNITVA
jgi:hypothetical protein